MNLNKKHNQILEKKESSRLKKRRAVTEIISTMMLMGVTVSGATTLTYFMNDAFTSGSIGTATTLDSSSLNVLLLAYDTRDSSTLLTIPSADNKYDSLLCGSSCSSTPNNLPANDGTEFIVLQIRNNNLNSLFLKGLTLNGDNYSWDPATSTQQLDISAPYAAGKYPSEGTFSILPVGSTPIFQSDNFEIESGDTVNVLLKLDSSEPDIELNRGIRVLLNFGNIQPTEFLLESGDAR